MSSIKGKMSAILTTLNILMILTCGVFYLLLNKIDDTYTDALGPSVAMLQDADDLKYLVTHQRLQTILYMQTEDASEKQTRLTRLKENQEEIVTLFDKIKQDLDSEKSLAIFKTIETNYTDFNHLVEQATNPTSKMSIAEYVKNATMTRVIDEATNELAETTKVYLGERSEQASKTASNGGIIGIVMAIVIFTITSIAGIYLLKTLVNPLRTLEKSVLQVADGDLTGDDVILTTKDETARLATAFNAMKNMFNNIANALTTSSNDLSGASQSLATITATASTQTQQMANASQNIENNMNTSVNITNESAIAVDETAQAVQRIAESAQTLNTSASDTAHEAQEGGINIRSASEQMNVIYDSTELTTKLIHRLSEQSKQIEQMTHVITDISDQTNLLALNASIEAARAGEHGKGFAVVADEVRKLAEESNTSAAQISTLIADIQHDTVSVEKAVTASLKTVEDGVTAIHTAGNSFTKISQAIDNLTAQIEDISAVTEEISATSEEVAASVTEIATGAQDSLALSQTANAETQNQLAVLQKTEDISAQLENQAHELKEILKQFTL